VVVLKVDVNKPDNIGISCFSTVEEAVGVADAKVTKILENNIKSRTVIPDEILMFVHCLATGTRLPPNIHLSRDTWSDAGQAPRGHSCLNSMHGERTGADFELKLKTIDSLFNCAIILKYKIAQVPEFHGFVVYRNIESTNQDFQKEEFMLAMKMLAT